MIPASGKVFAENEKVRLCVVKESEKQDYIALSYTYSCMKSAFKDEEFINLTEKGLKLFLNGVQLTYHLVDGIYRIYQDDKFIGIGTIKNELLKRDIII